MEWLKGEAEAEAMTNSQFDAFLETIAKRIEAETGDTEAARIVREAKTAYHE